MKKIIITSAVLMALASCSKESNDPAVTDPVADNLVQFASDLEQVTSKGIPVEGTSLKQAFGVFAYKNSGYQDQKNLTPDFMYNQEIKYHNGDFSYTPPVYWPGSGSVSFFAYTPYHQPATEFVHPSSAHDKGWPEVKYTVKSIVKDQEDFMVSEILKKEATKSKVTFSFKHALTKIGFMANLEEDYEGCAFKIKSIVVKDVKNTGTFCYEDYTSSVKNWWKNTSGSVDYTVGLVHSAGVDVTCAKGNTLAHYNKCNADDQYLLAMPQSFNHNNNAKVVVTYSMTRGGKTENMTASFDLKSCEDWEPGCCIIYVIKIKMSCVEFGAVVQPWKDCIEQELCIDATSYRSMDAFDADVTSDVAADAI